MLGTIQSIGTYTIANKFKRLIPNSITDLSLSNYTIIYQNDCASLGNLTANTGVSVVSSTYRVPSLYANYGSMNTGVSLLNTTIVVDMSSSALGNFFFGCNSVGAGFMLRFETRTVDINYISCMTPTGAWNGYGPVIASTYSGTTTRMDARVWYTIIISISPTGTIKWAAQKRNTSSFINNTIYAQDTAYTVSNANQYIGVVGDGAGSTLYTDFDNIKIYNQALL